MNTINTQSNAVPDSPRDSQIHDSANASSLAEPGILSATRPFYWSLRRELWENRSIYIAPLAVVALILVSFMISTFRLPSKMRAAAALDPMHLHELIQKPYEMASLLLMGTMLIVGVFYSLDALYGERRDRSILFWKSLPVSDLTAVLSKAIIPVLILPLLCFAITIATQWIMLLLSTAVLLGSGMSAATLWTHVPMVQMSLQLLFHLLAVHGLYFAPIYGWLMLVSGWARRAPFLWAVVPPFAIGIVERIAFNTSHFAALLGSRLSGDEGGAASAPGKAMNSMNLDTMGQFLVSPGLWIGLLVFAAFLAAAVRLRRNQGPV